MTNPPEVTTIVLNYKNAEMTSRCVDSLLLQDYPYQRIVIVDNDSRDGSFRYLSERYDSFPDISVIETEQNIGYAGGNNHGARHALNSGSPAYLLISNDDIEIQDTQALSKLVDYAESKPDLGGLGPCIHLPGGFLQGPYRRPSLFPLILQNLLPPLWFFLGKIRQRNIASIDEPRPVYRVIGAFMLLDSRTFEQVGFFDEDTFMCAEELILAEKYATVGRRFYYNPQIEVLHNHQNSSTRRTGQSWRVYTSNIDGMSYYLSKYRGYPRWAINLYRFSAMLYYRYIHRFKVKYIIKEE